MKAGLGGWWLRTALGALLVIGLAATGGCKKGNGGQAAGASAEASKRAAKPKVRNGLTEDWRIDHPECAEGRRVRTPDVGSPEDVVWKLYQAGLAADSDETFQRFYAGFDPNKYEEKWVRDQFWPRLRKHVSKYVTDEKDPSFIICREEKKGDTRVKFFVFSSDATKSHTPIGLSRVEGRWAVDFFTP